MNKKKYKRKNILALEKEWEREEEKQPKDYWINSGREALHTFAGRASIEVVPLEEDGERWLSPALVSVTDLRKGEKWMEKQLK